MAICRREGAAGSPTGARGRPARLAIGMEPEGVRPYLAQSRSSRGFSARDAERWVSLHASPEDAAVLVSGGIDPADVPRWRSSGIPLADWPAWRTAGVPPHEATRWLAAGLSPLDPASARERGGQPPPHPRAHAYGRDWWHFE